MKLTVNKTTNRRRRGFTLVEVLLVMTILAIMAGLVLPKITGKSQQAREDAVRAQCDAFKTGLNMFEVDNGYYPRDMKALVEKPHDAANWHGPYLDKDTIPLGPWHQPYVYQYPGKHNPGTFDIYTTDQNGVQHGNWETAAK